jgi:hypothetical protein
MIFSANRRPLRRIMRYQILANAPLFSKFVREGAAMNHEFRKRGTSQNADRVNLSAAEPHEMNDKLLLVGSIPLDTVQDVFETFGAPLGRAMAAIPDGEVGPRRHWISRVHYQVLAAHPELDIVRRPKPDNGVERLSPRDASDSWLFRVKDGVERVRFGDPGWRLGYARDAINSYFVFATLREKGVLARHLRFQVSLPSVNSVLPPRIFPNTADLDKIKPGYEDALAAEVAKIVEKIPENSSQGPRDPVGLRQRGRRRLWQHSAVSARGRNRAQRCAVQAPLRGNPRRCRARLPPLLRHARRLAAFQPAEPWRSREPRQCTDRNGASARRLDAHAGA